MPLIVQCRRLLPVANVDPIAEQECLVEGQKLERVVVGGIGAHGPMPVLGVDEHALKMKNISSFIYSSKDFIIFKNKFTYSSSFRCQGLSGQWNGKLPAQLANNEANFLQGRPGGQQRLVHQHFDFHLQRHPKTPELGSHRFQLSEENIIL
jgi:hypothetical protein